MAVASLKGNVNVLEAARQRVINVFNTGLPINLSMSGGKDSICLADVVMQLMVEGKINPNQLTIQFIDEEAIFDDVEKIVLEWRKKFLLSGAKFEWYCIQVKHFNCLNSLSDEETFITWDSYKRETWVRPMPSFAIKTHPMLRERKDTYQQFLSRINKGSIQLIGIRAAESLMRRKNIATITSNPNNSGGINSDNSIFPIYDWADDDIWLHIKNRKLNFPNTYMDLWRIGEGRRGMRLSQFFSIDTASVLTRLDEHQPQLMQRVIRREPNAYLTSLYWDTEMFRRGSIAKNKKNGNETKDYKKEVLRLLGNIEQNFDSKEQKKNAVKYKKIVLQHGAILNEKKYSDIYNAIIGGDPKNRTYRGIVTGIFSDSMKQMKKELSEEK